MFDAEFCRFMIYWMLAGLATFIAIKALDIL